MPPPPSRSARPYEERERDTLRTRARQQLGSPARAGARIALAICEVEAGLRSPLQLEQRCHLSLWPKLSARLRRSGGPAVPIGSLVRVVAQEYVPGLAEVLVLVRRAVGWCRWRCGWTGPRAAGSWSSSSTDRRRVWRGSRTKARARRPASRQPSPELSTVLDSGVVAAAGLAIVGL
jgi:hypothetical protein